MPSNRVIHFEQNIPVQLALQTVQGLRIRHAGQWQMLFLTVSGQRVYLPESTAATIQRIAKSDEPIVICKRRGRYDVWLAGEAEKQRARDEAPEIARELREHGNGAGVPSTERSDAGVLPHASAPPVIPFPAPPTRQEEREPLKPTGTDSLPVPALQPKLSYAGFDVDGDTCEDLQKERYELESAEAGGERRLDSGVGCERLGGPTVTRKRAQGSPKVANPVISLPLSSPASLSTSVAMRLQPGQNRQASIPNRPPKPPGRVGYGHALEHICKTVKSVLCETGLVLGDGPTQDLISTVFIAAQKEKSIDFDFGEAA